MYSLISRNLPAQISYQIADFIGYIVSIITHADCHKRAAIMRRICGERISIQEAVRLVRKNMQFFNRDLVDFFRAGRLSQDKVVNEVHIDGLCYLNEALKKGRGVILVSVHLGSWEMAGIALALLGYPVYGMVWEPRNKLVAGLMTKIRSPLGVQVVESSSLRTILRLLQRNMVIGIMLDINGGKKGVSFSPWGLPVMLPRGPAALSRVSGAEILIVVMLRNNDEGYRLYIEKAAAAGTEEEITRRLFVALKKHIENNPVQWHWIRYFLIPPFASKGRDKSRFFQEIMI